MYNVHFYMVRKCVILRMTMLLSTNGSTTMTSSSCLRCETPIGSKGKWLFVSGLFPPKIGLAQQLDTILPLGSLIFGIWWILTKILQLLNVGAYYRTYDPQKAIALDRFVHKLTGRANEVIERRSTQSALTMKEAGLTLDMSVKFLLGFNIIHFRL